MIAHDNTSFIFCNVGVSLLTVFIYYLCAYRLKLQDQEQQRAAGLNTATATVYSILFAMATLACFTYKHRLQDQRAHHRVKVST